MQTCSSHLTVDEQQHHDRSSDWIADIDADLATVHGHRHITDSYLVSLTRSRGGLLATLDSPLTHRHPEHTLLLPPGV